MPRYGNIYHDAVRIQKLLKARMDDPMIKPSDLASLAKAWDTIEDRKRIIKGKGTPKPVDSAEKVKPRVALSFIE